MTETWLNQSVGELVVENPSRSRVFEQFGIDYCCGGRRVLKDACSCAGVEEQKVLAAINEADARGTAEPDRDWSRAPLTELVDHIVATHHDFLRRELPRLQTMTEKVAAVHGENHPEMVKTRDIFAALKDEMESHMAKEEQILFPLIVGMERVGTPRSHAGPVHAHATGGCCSSVQNPIAVMEHEHDQAGQALSRMRRLTNDYTPPHDACNTFRAILAGLADLEADMHRHVHKENNILFPRATALEQA